ncbi:MAG: hypothetical protein HLUCCX10_16750 [Algoriphagus marincola HL-49]|uniref:RHS repeat-associated core domain n=1 Tax=Algoriphagus marincola HL-49 TaxID=1305737 RepID=A0A0N8KDM4_9BACT|nr:MAG: hypothetical protein HLUCCX10_16750 [Algoriphagus marincola HL-49]
MDIRHGAQVLKRSLSTRRVKTYGLPAGKGRFDQFRIQSTGPLIVQETHYDPWGVELGGLGYQYGGIKVNPYLYNED